MSEQIEEEQDEQDQRLNGEHGVDPVEDDGNAPAIRADAP